MNLKITNKITIVLLMFCGSLQAVDFINWTTPKTISPIHHDSWLPYVAIDNDNNDLCVWRFLNANSQRAAALWFDDATEQWQPAATFLSKSVSAQGAYEESVAMDGQGNAWAIWRQMSGLTKFIQVSRFEPETGWWPISQALTLSDTSKSAYYPVISMNQNGMAIACWTWDNIVQAAIANSSTWGASVTLSGTDAAQVGCFINNQGSATVVWQRFATDHYQIESASYANGVWEPFVVLSNDTNNAYNPQVAMDGEGNAIAVWYEQEITGSLSVYSSKKAVGSFWQTPVQLSPSSNSSAKFPQVAMNVNGNAMILWEQYDGSNWYIAGRNGSFAQANFDPEVAISQAGHDAFDPRVVLNVFGSAIATWTFYDNQTVKRIQVARYDAKGKSWTNILNQTLLSDASNAQSAKIAINPASDDLVVGWQIFEHFIWRVQVTMGTQARPTIICATQTFHRFPRFGTIVNSIKWTAVAGAVSYQIFDTDNTTLLATISALCPLKFSAYNIAPHSVHTYYVYAVAADGTYSDPAVVTIS